MVKLVDTPASGAGDRKVVEVRVFFWAPIQTKPSLALGFVLSGVWFFMSPLKRHSQQPDSYKNQATSICRSQLPTNNGATAANACCR
jgi:hypothetical protein